MISDLDSNEEEDDEDNFEIAADVTPQEMEMTEDIISTLEKHFSLEWSTRQRLHSKVPAIMCTRQTL
jgi:hypothetical protein